MPSNPRRPPPRPPSRSPAAAGAAPVRRDAPPPVRPLDDTEIERLETLLDAIPAPYEALDAGLLDGFLCGVLLQPRPVPDRDWLRHVTDADGRALPEGHDPRPLHALVLRRRDELEAAIQGRRWFDPWVFELEAEGGDEDPSGADDDDLADPGDPSDPRHELAELSDDADEPAPIEAVYPWAAGFATALDLFPGLMALDPSSTLEPLALVYRHLAPDDLEDADALLAEIESLEPAADLEEAVEDLVRATLLLADVSRPLPAAPRPGAGPRAGAGRRPRR